MKKDRSFPSVVAAPVANMISPWTIFSALVLVLVVGVVTLLIEFIKRTGRNHSAESASASPTFFKDPSSLQRVACPSIFDAAEKYISLIIPAFNEEHRLPGTLEETLNYLQQRAVADKSFSYEVVIVDDGSNDRTAKIAFDFVRKHTIDVVRVILLGRNYGKGEAIRKGMLHSRGELLLMLDADGATKVTDLAKLEYQICKLAEKELQSGAAASSNSTPKISDVAVAAFGSRAHLEKQALATRKWYRNFLMKGFHLVVLLTAGPGIRDTQCGFKMFSRAAARKLFTNIHLKRWLDVVNAPIGKKGRIFPVLLTLGISKLAFRDSKFVICEASTKLCEWALLRWCFDVELVYLSKRLKIPMIEVSVNWSEIPGSKVRLTSIMHMLFELVLIRLGYGLGMWKIHT